MANHGQSLGDITNDDGDMDTCQYARIGHGETKQFGDCPHLMGIWAMYMIRCLSVSEYVHISLGIFSIRVLCANEYKRGTNITLGTESTERDERMVASTSKGIEDHLVYCGCP